MKKKIMIFVLLFVFLAGMGVPDQAKAEEIAFTIEDFKIAYEALGDDLKNDLNMYPYVFGISKDGYISFLVFNRGEVPDSFYYALSYNNVSSVGYSNVNDNGGCNGSQYSFINGEWKNSAIISFFETDEELSTIKASYFDTFYNRMTSSPYQSILSSPYKTGFSTLDEFLNPPYTFENWCSDAGLNCAASSNESDSVIPFWYEPDSYNYIVRKVLTASSTSGVYQLTMLQRNSSSGHYPYYFEVNDIGYLGVAGFFVDTSAFTIRNFYYDPDGNGWKLVEKFDVSSLPFDNTNVTFTDNTVFIFTDTDIYADREAASVWLAASTEYYNVDIPEPEITRVPVGGGSTVGGNAEPGGLLDFVITLLTLTWTELFAVEVPVDGYSISFQAIVIWGAIAGLLIWGGCKLFGKKG